MARPVLQLLDSRASFGGEKACVVRNFLSKGSPKVLASFRNTSFSSG
jgi:hypothetical protein